MKKYKNNIIIGVFIICSIISFKTFAKQNELNNVLVLYDTLDERGEFAGNLKLVIDMLVCFGKKSYVKNISNYEVGEIETYEAVIVIKNASYEENKIFILGEDIKKFNKPIIYIGKEVKKVLPQIPVISTINQNKLVTIQVDQFRSNQFLAKDIELIIQTKLKVIGEIKNQYDNIFPFAVRDNNVTYIPYLKANTISKIALAKVMKESFNILEDGNYYLVVSNIYPFSDLNKLIEISDVCSEHGIPFICSIVPIFENTDYPAIKRYMQVLRYVQSNEGSIIVQTPNVREGELEKEPLGNKIEVFIDTLIGYDVIPMGVAVKRDWLDSSYYEENLFKFFTSNILMPSEKKHINEEKNYYSFSKNIYGINWGDIKQITIMRKKGINKAPIDLGIILDLNDDNLESREYIKTLNKNIYPIENYKNINQKVKTNKNKVETRHGNVKVNEKEKSFFYLEKPLKIAFKSTESIRVSLEKSFMIGNKILLGIIIISLLIFVGLILIGIRLHRNKFIK